MAMDRVFTAFFTGIGSTAAPVTMSVSRETTAFSLPDIVSGSLTVPERCLTDQLHFCNGTRNNNSEAWTSVVIPPSVLQRVSLMAVFMVIALIGNTAVLVVLFKSRGRQRSIQSFFISLAASDILIAIFSMPTELVWDVFGGWLLGNIACKLLTYVQCILFASTAFIHMSIGYDRYEAVCKPKFFTERSLRNRWMITASWILAFFIAVPQLFIFLEIETGIRDDGASVYACRSNGYSAEWQRKLYVTWIALYMFLIPLCTITYCYARIARVVWKYDVSGSPDPVNGSLRSDDLVIRSSKLDRAGGLSPVKLKTLQVTVCVVFSYTFCWIPYFAVALLNVWSDYKYKEQINNSPVGPLAQCLAWFSSCINPIIYGFFSLPQQFRRSNWPAGCTGCTRSQRTTSSRKTPKQRYIQQLPFHVPHVNATVAQQMFPVRPHRKQGAFHGRLHTKSENDVPLFNVGLETSDTPVQL